MAKLKVRTHVETVKHIKSTLNHGQKELFRKSCFGQFLKIEILKHSSLYFVLFRQINKGMLREEL